MIEHVVHQDVTYAVVIRGTHAPRDCIEFCTPPDYSQQLAYMHRLKGEAIRAHRHNEVHRSVKRTCETLFIRKGRVRTDLFDESDDFICSVELVTGDVILLVCGGHGFTMLEDSEIVEVKQGPYAGEQDKCFLEKGRCRDVSGHDAG